jgi:Development and cell death domain
MSSKNGFIFLCDQETESECIAKQMVGTTQLNALWAATIKSGDDIYLFNFKTGVVRGPYSASSAADCFDRSAWGGRFPIQVRISATNYTRHADSRTANAPSVLRKKRPSGELGTAPQELFLWLQTQSKDP